MLQFVAALYVAPVPAGTVIVPEKPDGSVEASMVGGVVHNIITLVKRLQPLNADTPIEVTPLPIVTLVRLLQL